MKNISFITFKNIAVKSSLSLHRIVPYFVVPNFKTRKVDNVHLQNMSDM